MRPIDDDDAGLPGRQSGTEPAVRVLVVDDHTLFRGGLRNMLVDEGFDVVEARSGEQAVEAATTVAPDVVLMDLNMPGISGVEATRQVKEVAPATPVVMLTVSADEQDVLDAVLAGASGYLLKDASLEDIVGCIGAAVGGEAWVSPRVAAALLDRVRTAAERAAREPLPVKLTERETEILRLIAEGKDNAEIGAALYISPRTVKNHISSLLTKLQIENRIQAAVYAVRRGLV